jgi:predicted enzyme related to lactoylglutathione lyase
MKILGTDYIFYNVSDMKKAITFYRDILGLKATRVDDMWAEFETGNLTLSIGVFGADTSPKAVKNCAAAALAVDDIKAAVEYLKSKNVQVLQDVMSFDPCSMAIILDPDNNQIILHQRKDGSVG